MTLKEMKVAVWSAKQKLARHGIDDIIQVVVVVNGETLYDVLNEIKYWGSPVRTHEEMIGDELWGTRVITTGGDKRFSLLLDFK